MMKAIEIIKEDIHLEILDQQYKIMLKAEGFSVVQDFVDMVLAKHFIKNLMFYIMEKKEQVKK